MNCLVKSSPVYLLFLLLYSFGFHQMSGQSLASPDQYRSFQPAEKSSLFLDAFDDNRNRWILLANKYSGQIEQGRLSLSSENPKVMIQWKEVQLPTEGDFEIELRMRNVFGNSESMAGLSFGIHEAGSRFVFWERPDGMVRISREESGKRYDFQAWQNCPAQSKAHSNVYVLRQLDDQWYFFVNESLVASMEARPLFGKGIGIAIKGPMSIEVDQLRVSELKARPKNQDVTGPTIKLLSPHIKEGFPVVLDKGHLPLSGSVSDPSGIASLEIDQQPVSLDKYGNFYFVLRLKEGEKRSLVLKTKDVHGNTSQKVLDLVFPQPEASVAFQPVRPRPEWANTSQPVAATPKETGKNYLLLIGVDQYSTWSPLRNAVKDCDDVAKVLVDRYQFQPEQVIRIFNAEATRSNILNEMERLQKLLQPEDNLLIYYAGHGYYDTSSELGYWVPVHAKRGSVPDYIPNSTIHDYLRVIHTKHTLLFADACYAGSLFASHRGEILANAPSRWAFTSGDIEKVWDGEPGKNSPFAEALIRYLTYNQQGELPANQLIEGVSDMISREVKQSPQGNPLRTAGDEGGVFVFRKK